MKAILLAGGSGTRLWPLSRKNYPKQFLKINGNSSLLKQTAERFLKVVFLEDIIVITNNEYKFYVKSELDDLNNVILEPVSRNTAPAIALGIKYCIEKLGCHKDEVIFISPSDHIIKPLERFVEYIGTAEKIAKQGYIVTFGIKPERSETGYGYIKAGKQWVNKPSEGSKVFEVERFVEKPDIAKARSYVESGDYFWNSGMFMFKATHYIKELEKFMPEMLASCKKAYGEAGRDNDFVRLESKAFSACPSDSIDYAVMEKTSDAVVIPLDADWSDVGSWSALWEIGEQDSNGNVIRGDVVSHDTTGCYVNAGSRLVATVGVENHVIVETPDAVLVAHKDRVQDVKVIVNQLNAQGRSEAIMHRKVFRPWGSYQSIDNADRFQVKRITVNPGASLSLQMHHHRAEHWIVVKGTARVTRGEESIMLSENQSTYIPLGVRHRLENPGVIHLELIEVQSGAYLGEDDIVRFDDVDGRGSNQKVS